MGIEGEVVVPFSVVAAAVGSVGIGVAVAVVVVVVEIALELLLEGFTELSVSAGEGLIGEEAAGLVERPAEAAVGITVEVEEDPVAEAELAAITG